MRYGIVALGIIVVLILLAYIYNELCDYGTPSTETPTVITRVDGRDKTPMELIDTVIQLQEPILAYLGPVSADAIGEKISAIVQQSEHLEPHEIRQVRYYNESKQRGDALNAEQLHKIYTQRVHRMKDPSHQQPKKKCYLTANDAAPLLHREQLEHWIDPAYTYQLWHCQRDTVTPQHIDDLYVISLQLCGSKRWTIAAPKYYEDACPQKDRPKFFHVTNPKNRDSALRACPSWARVSTLDVDVPAGYALVMPPNWLHRVETLDESLMLNLLFYKDAL